MAANQRPVFALTPKTPTANLSVANTANAVVASPTDGTDFRQVYQCSTVEGSKITLIAYQFIGTGTPSAAIFNIWLTDTSNANARVIRSVAVAVAAGAISTVLPGPYAELTFSDFQLENGQRIYVSLTTMAANTTLNVRASIGDFA
jgi:hypothetical protein